MLSRAKNFAMRTMSVNWQNQRPSAIARATDLRGNGLKLYKKRSEVDV